MKKYIVLLVSFLALWGEWSMAVPGPIDFTNAGTTLVKRLPSSFESARYLYKSGTDDHANKFFTARTLLRLGPAPLSQYEQKMLRNEICASNKIYAVVGAKDVGSFGVYKLGQSVVSIADLGLTGKPLETVLRELNDSSLVQKIFFAKYYVANMAAIVDLMDRANIIVNGLDLRNFYVRPDGRLSAYDLNDAISDPATLVVDKQNQLKQFMTDTVRKLYDRLFPNPTEAQTQYQDIVTQARGTDARLGADADAVRTHNWALADIKAVIANSLGANAYNANPGVPFGGGIDGGLLGNNAAAVAAAFDGNIDNFLDRANHKPWVSNNANNIAVIDHSAAIAGNRGAGAAVNFGIDDAVRLLLIDPATAAAYVDLAAMCNGWTGK